MHRTIISFVQPQPNSIKNKNKNNPIGCGTAPGNLVFTFIFILGFSSCVESNLKLFQPQLSEVSTETTRPADNYTHSHVVDSVCFGQEINI